MEGISRTSDESGGSLALEAEMQGNGRVEAVAICPLLAPRFCDPPDVLINFAGDEMTSCSVTHCPERSLEMVIHASAVCCWSCEMCTNWNSQFNTVHLRVNQ